MSSGVVATTFGAPITDAPARCDVPALTAREETDIKVSGLSKSFNGSRAVLDNINLTIPSGQAVALIGHNGSGKSTLLRCCLRLVEPSSGAVHLLGREITDLKKKQLRDMRSRIGFVFQRHNLVPRLSVLTNVLHGIQARKKGPKTWFQWLAPQDDREEAMRHLQRVGLEHLAVQRVDRLSGGESQRVAIARALMQSPRLVMADEPAASLDPVAGEEVMKLFINLIKAEGLTLLFVSHNLEHALAYADRVVGLRNGKLELDSPVDRENAASLRELYG